MALVEYELRDHIATIRLNRPERLNATSPELHEELVAAFADFVDNDDAWVAILTGTGRAFCAGRDIKIQAETGAAPTPEYTRLWNLFGIADTDKPLITAINGYAIGAGWYMVIGSDIRIAAESATFGMGEIPTGVLGPYWLGSTEGIPWALNTEFTLLGEHVSARRLLEAGMLNEVVPDDQLMETAERWARKFIALPPLHVRRTKALMRAMRPMPDAPMMDREREARAFLNPLQDTIEAAKAFAEKRNPQFHGQ